jgi:hypothetical protein
MRSSGSCILASSAFLIWCFSFSGIAQTAVITVVNLDAPGEGFNDPAAPDPASGAGGNSGATLGAQRLIAFQRAAAIWATHLSSPVEITIDANFDSLPCSATSATLGAAGATTVHRDFAGALRANIWYPQALANSLAGTDLSPGDSDVAARFSSALGTTCTFPRSWYYGLDGNPPGNALDFVSVVLHELGHGLGFQSFVDLASGTKLLGLDDVFSLNLEDHSTGKRYPQMTNQERVVASQNSGNLHWIGANVTAASGLLTAGRHSSGHVRMYAPNPQQPGSSVSHFDTALTPNELMEPFYVGPNHSVDLAAELFVDLGWMPSGASDDNFHDFDGDGKADLVLRGTNNTFWVARSTGEGFAIPELWLQHGGQYLDGQAQYADLDGDGKADVVFQGGDNAFWVSLSTGTGFTSPVLWVDHGGGYFKGQAQYADLNGDGKADMIFRGLDNALWVSLSTGVSFSSPALWLQHGGGYLHDQARYADLNWDGRASVIFQGDDNTFWVSLSTGVNFTSPALWIDHGGGYLQGQAQYADLNGDGKADMIFQGGDNTFWVSLSTGVNFTSPALWIDHGGGYLQGQAQYADLNGDGRVDMIFQGGDNTFWVALSTGLGFTPPALWTDHGDGYVQGQAQYADLNGDGRADLIFQSQDNSFWVSLSTGANLTTPQLWLRF